METKTLVESVEGFAQFMLVAPPLASIIAGIATMALLAVGGIWAVRPR